MGPLDQSSPIQLMIHCQNLSFYSHNQALYHTTIRFSWKVTPTLFKLNSINSDFNDFNPSTNGLLDSSSPATNNSSTSHVEDPSMSPSNSYCKIIQMHLLAHTNSF